MVAVVKAVCFRIEACFPLTFCEEINGFVAQLKANKKLLNLCQFLHTAVMHLCNTGYSTFLKSSVII